MSDFINMAANWVLLSGIVPLVLFMLSYRPKNVEGRTLWAQKLVTLAFVLVVTASLFFGEYPFRAYIRILVYGAMVTFFWITYVQLVRLKRQVRQDSKH